MSTQKSQRWSRAFAFFALTLVSSLNIGGHSAAFAGQRHKTLRRSLHLNIKQESNTPATCPELLREGDDSDEVVPPHLDEEGRSRGGSPSDPETGSGSWYDWDTR